MKTLFALIVFFFLCLSGYGQVENYSKGVEYYKSQSYDSALYVFQELCNKNSYNDSAMTYLGQTYYKLHDTIASYEYFYKSLRINANNKKTLFALATNYFNEDQYDSALAYYNKAIDVEPLFFDAYNNRGLVLLDTKRFTESKSDFLFLLEKGQKINRVYYNLGLVEFNQNNYQESIKYYSKAISVDETDFISYWNRSLAYLNLKKYKKDLLDLDKTLQINPSYTDVYINKGIVYTELKEYSNAIQEYTKYINIYPTEGEAYYYRGLCKLSIKDNSACEDLSKAYTFGETDAKDEIVENCK